MKKIHSKAIPLHLDDVDTDMIIPAKHLTTIEREGLGKHLFAEVRQMDPHFPLNLPQHQEREILLAGRNFGCGSSREHAVWALVGWGIKAVIAHSFADIFYNNALKNFLLPIQLPQEVVKRLYMHTETVQIHLEEQRVTFSTEEHTFEIDPYRKQCLLHQMDDLDYLLSKKEQITQFKQKQPLYFDTGAIR